MKKLINLFLFIFVVFSWKIYLDDIENNSKNYNEHIKKADSFYRMGAYLDSFEEYEAAESFMNDKQKQYVFEKKSKIMLLEKEYLEAKKLIDKAFLDRIFVDNLAIEYLETCLKDEKYKLMNDFINQYRQHLDLSAFEKKIKAKYLIYPSEYSEIKQIGDKLFLLSDGDRDYLVDNRGRRVFTSYYDKVIGFDEMNRLITVIDKGENYVVDMKKNIRAKLLKGDVTVFFDGAYVLNDNTLLNQISDKIFESEYLTTPSEGSFVTVAGSIILRDLAFNKLANFKGNKVKVNLQGQAVVNGSLIIKNKKERVYKLDDKTFSDFYDEISFSSDGGYAVRKGNSWALMDVDFNLLTDFVFEEAEALSNGIALVKKNGSKYFIDENLNKLDDFLYEDFVNFNSEGVGFIKDKGLWKMIKLIRREV